MFDSSASPPTHNCTAANFVLTQPTLDSFIRTGAAGVQNIRSHALDHATVPSYSRFIQRCSSLNLVKRFLTRCHARYGRTPHLGYEHTTSYHPLSPILHSTLFLTTYQSYRSAACHDTPCFHVLHHSVTPSAIHFPYIPWDPKATHVAYL